MNDVLALDKEIDAYEIRRTRKRLSPTETTHRDFALPGRKYESMTKRFMRGWTEALRRNYLPPPELRAMTQDGVMNSYWKSSTIDRIELEIEEAMGMVIEAKEETAHTWNVYADDGKAYDYGSDEDQED